jgi:hypothetical protein
MIFEITFYYILKIKLGIRTFNHSSYDCNIIIIITNLYFYVYKISNKLFWIDLRVLFTFVEYTLHKKYIFAIVHYNIIFTYFSWIEYST